MFTLGTANALLAPMPSAASTSPNITTREPLDHVALEQHGYLRVDDILSASLSFDLL
jgi:hypothetical protein